MKIREMLMVWFACLFICTNWAVTIAQTPTPPYIEVTKEILNEPEEICPGFIIDVSIRLTGSGSSAFLRFPVNAVVCVDKSGSMGYGGDVGFNAYATPLPYAPWGTPGFPIRRRNPYVATIWAAWKFYQYFVDNPPQYGYDDYGALVFYSDAVYPNGVPGPFAVETPTTIQRVRDDPDDPSHKQFWWFDHLVPSQHGGSTAMGPAMQIARNIIEVMPMHIPSYGILTPTPSTPKPDIEGNNFMVLMSDGRPWPGAYWAPGPGEEPPWAPNEYAHAIEMARRCSLKEPFSAYTQTWDTTIFTLGLGSQVDTLLMRMLADPWNPIYWGPSTPLPDPTIVNRGFFSWALTEDDLIDTFETIADHIVSNLAGSNIHVVEMMPAVAGTCPGGGIAYTEIIPDSWNYPPTVIPASPPAVNDVYTWNFEELLIGDELIITFQMQVPTAAPFNTGSLIECPESSISYENDFGVVDNYPIYDPGFDIGPCDQPTSTPSPTPTPTSTPTCVQQVLFFDDFESGDFTEWNDAVPTWGVEVYDYPDYAHSDSHFAFLAGCEETSGFGSHEANIHKILSFDDPIRPGANLEFYVRLKNFTFPQKLNAESRDPQPYDLFIVEVSDLDPDGTGSFWFQEFSQTNETNDYFHVRIPLHSFAGSNAVRIRLVSLFPVTTDDPGPWNTTEPMVFIDDVLVYDYCYEPTPTPTMTPTMPPPIPATTTSGIGFALLVISLFILIPLVRKVW